MSHTQVVVKYNSSTGSNTNPSDCVASSVGTSVTASGTGNGTTITFSAAVDLSGAADDDSDFIWCATNGAQKHLFQITAFSPSKGACTSITVGESISSDFSGAAWHINGTRQSLEADVQRCDVEDMARGFTFEFDGDFVVSNRWMRIGNGIDYVASQVDDPPMILRASPNATSRPTIDVQLNRGLIYVGADYQVRVSGLKLTCSTGGGANSLINIRNGSFVMDDCVVTAPGGTAASLTDFTGGISVAFHNCYFKGGSTYVFDDDAANYVTISNCVFDCADTYGTTAAVRLNATNCNILLDTLILESAGVGVLLDATHNTGRQTMWVCKNVTAVDCAGDGFQLSGTPNATSNPCWSVNIVNCLSANNGGYGFNLDDTHLHSEQGYQDYNCAFNNTSGGFNGYEAGANDITITADPFTDAANDDYTLNADPNGGALLQNAALHQLPDGT